MSLEHSPSRQSKDGRATPGDGGSKKSYSPSEFCKVEDISRAALYKAWRKGRSAAKPFGIGPRYYLIGAHRRISEEAREDFHREGEERIAAKIAAAEARA